MAPWCLAVPITASSHDVTDSTVVQTLDAFDIAGAMMPLEPDANFQVFLFGFFDSGQKASNARRIGGNGFFRKDMFALAHGFLELHGAEAWRRGQDDNVGERNGLLVGVEADKLMFGG